MFTPIVERKVDDKGPPALKPMPAESYKFEDLLVRATETLHQADPKRLKIQQLYSEFRYKNAQKRLLQFQFSEPIELARPKEGHGKTPSNPLQETKYLKEEHERATASVIKALKDSKFDCEYEVNQIMLNKSREIDELNERNK